MRYPMYDYDAFPRLLQSLLGLRSRLGTVIHATFKSSWQGLTRWRGVAGSAALDAYSAK